MALVMEKKAFICCFPVDACSNLATHLYEFHFDERHFVIDCYSTSFVKLINLKGVLYSVLQEKL